MAPCSARCRASASCSAAVLSLRADLRQSLSTRELRASRSLSGSLEQRTNQQCSPQELLGFLLKTFFFSLPLPGAAGFKNMAPPIRAEVLRVLYWNPHFRQGAGRHLPPRRGSAAGTLCAPQAGNFSRWGRRGSIWGSERGSGPKYGHFCYKSLYRDLVKTRR